MFVHNTHKKKPSLKITKTITKSDGKTSHTTHVIQSVGHAPTPERVKEAAGGIVQITRHSIPIPERVKEDDFAVQSILALPLQKRVEERDFVRNRSPDFEKLRYLYIYFASVQ